MKITILLCTSLLGLTFATAQTAAPVVVQAVPSTAAVVAPAPAPAQDQPAPSMAAALKAIQEMKAANEQTMRKQAATLQQLDELEKAAAQLKIYSKRG